jgi:hypothetical protein
MLTYFSLKPKLSSILLIPPAYLLRSLETNKKGNSEKNRLFLKLVLHWRMIE